MFKEIVIPIILTLSATTFGVQRKPMSSPFLRIESHIYFPKLNRQNNRIAFTNELGQGLSIVDLKSGNTFRVTSYEVGNSFFWAPDGSRLFYREVYAQNNHPYSELKAYDTFLKKNVIIEKFSGLTSSIYLDPRDYRFYILSQSGIKSHKLDYPTERMGMWKRSLKTKLGYWLVAGDRIFWVSNRGISMRQVGSDEPVYSFDISPDGRSIVWATQGEKIYSSYLQ